MLYASTNVIGPRPHVLSDYVSVSASLGYGKRMGQPPHESVQESEPGQPVGAIDVLGSLCKRIVALGVGGARLSLVE